MSLQVLLHTLSLSGSGSLSKSSKHQIELLTMLGEWGADNRAVRGARR